MIIYIYIIVLYVVSLCNVSEWVKTADFAGDVGGIPLPKISKLASKKYRSDYSNIIFPVKNWFGGEISLQGLKGKSNFSGEPYGFTHQRWVQSKFSHHPTL